MRGWLGGLILLWAAGAHAEPALWAVQGKHATIYLFGTMHMLPHAAEWYTPKVRKAFERSEVLWEEADVGIGDPAKLVSIMQQAMSRENLFTLLPPDYATKLRAELAKCGLPDMAVAHLKPWMAAMMPSVCAMMQDHVSGEGPAPSLGPEATLLQAAQQQGKAVAYFETAEQQIQYLAKGSQQTQLKQLEDAIDEAAGSSGKAFGDMETAWLAGDEAGLAREVDRLRREDPAEYRTIFTERNARFAERIAEMARGDGVYFVAIGAGHLVGSGSVREQLKKLGFSASPM